MTKEEKTPNTKEMKPCFHHHSKHGGSGEALYGLGVVGALFYFLSGVSTFGAVVTGIVKAIFWPAFVVFKVLTALGV